VQNKISFEPVMQSVLAQWPRKKVKILKFWLLGPFRGHCSPRTMTPRRDIFLDSDTTAKVVREYEKSPA